MKKITPYNMEKLATGQCLGRKYVSPRLLFISNLERIKSSIMFLQSIGNVIWKDKSAGENVEKKREIDITHTF